MRRYFLIVLSLIVLSMTPVFSDRVEDHLVFANSVVNIIHDDAAQEFVLCHLQPAVWGDYDVEIKVSGDYTYDRKPRTFRLFQGVYFEEIVRNINSLNVHRNGLVQPANKEQAFAKGIPFYITDLVFESPNLVHFTVFSNPNTSVDQAFVRIQQFRRGKMGYRSKLEIVNVREPLLLYVPSQRRTIKVDTYEGWILSIVKSHGIKFCCLISNEVPLR